MYSIRLVISSLITTSVRYHNTEGLSDSHTIYQSCTITLHSSSIQINNHTLCERGSFLVEVYNYLTMVGNEIESLQTQPSLQVPKQPFHLTITMPQRNITFQTSDNVTLRGWLFTPPESASTRLPCLVMSHGWSALKEMDLDAFANYFISKLPLACLVYDNRGFGDSDHAQGQPRQEIVPSVQRSDISDAITYAQSLPEVEPTRIGIWGSSYSGGHVLQVGAVDRRVKAVVSQAWVLPV